MHGVICLGFVSTKIDEAIDSYVAERAVLNSISSISIIAELLRLLHAGLLRRLRRQFLDAQRLEQGADIVVECLTNASLSLSIYIYMYISLYIYLSLSLYIYIYTYIYIRI